MAKRGSGRRRTAQRNLLYQESSLWSVAAAVIVLACVVTIAIAIFIS